MATPESHSERGGSNEPEGLNPAAWKDLCDIMQRFGELPAGDGQPADDIGLHRQEVTPLKAPAAAEEAEVVEDDLSPLIRELCRSEYAKPISIRVEWSPEAEDGEEDEDSEDGEDTASDWIGQEDAGNDGGDGEGGDDDKPSLVNRIPVVGCVLPCDSRPSRVVALFPKQYLVLHLPKDPEKAKSFMASFMPGPGYYLMSTPKEGRTICEQFLHEVPYEFKSLLRSDVPADEPAAWAALRTACENAPELKARRETVRQIQIDRAREELQQLFRKAPLDTDTAETPETSD